MDTRTINAILRTLPATRCFYLACVPCDAIPMPFNFPCAIVVNEDGSAEPGTHWTALYIRSPTTVWYFDSFGSAPVGQIARFLSHFKDVTSNICLFQSIDSSVCGHYCIYFLFMCCKRLTYSSILASLRRQSNPDVFVANFVRKLCKP